MVQLEYCRISKEIIISLGRKLIFLKTTTSNIQKEIHLPDNLKDLIPLPILTEEEKLLKQENPIPDIMPTIQHIKVSPNGQLLAITTNGHKSLLLYQLTELNIQLLSIRYISRVSSAINFSSNSNKILICDKTGDCYIYDTTFENIKKPGEWILGHLSIVYNVIFTPDEKYIITCDRDEKIRITNYPNCYEIESYCLGHTEYVAGIEILKNHTNLLLSISGDKSMKLWNWKIGKKLDEIELSAPAIRFCIKLLTDNIYEIYVLVYQPNQCIFVYELEILNNINYNFKHKLSKNFDSTIVTNICYIETGLLASIYQDKRLKIEYFNIHNYNNEVDLNLRQCLKDSIESSFQDEEFNEPEDVCGWFKKKFHNIDDYLDRKKRRINEKLMKK